jgi:hypothetical protein
VAERNTTFKIADTEKLLHQAIDSFSVSAWADCVRHAETLQDEDFKRDIVVDNALEPFIINLKVCDSSESDTQSSDKVMIATRNNTRQDILHMCT